MEKQTSIASQELTRIYNRDRCVKTSVVVEESRPDDAPLHDKFEWDDERAGHSFRLIQARRIIRVTPIMGDDDQPARLVHVPAIDVAESGHEGEYKPAVVIAESPDEFARARYAASARMVAAVNALEELDAVATRQPEQTRALVSRAVAAAGSAAQILERLQ